MSEGFSRSSNGSSSAIATLPNALSVARILLTPAFVWLIVDRDTTFTGLLLFGVVVSTDWLDGYLARRTGQVSEVGKMLDPTADRLAIAAGLVALVVRGAFPLWAALLILVRDVTILIAGVTLLVWSLIEAPSHGWISATTIGGIAGAATLLGIFAWWERRVPAPLLDVNLFRNMRFTAASLAITLGFFALFGFIFLVTQYLQLVKGYSAFQAGVRTLPFALAMVVAAVSSPKVVQRIGTKLVVSTGLALMAGGFAIAATNDASTPYSVIATAMILMGFGLGSAAAPATESILASVPREKAGVGSAVNDTTREIGGTLGVAVLGSIMASVYGGQILDALSGTPLPAGLRAAAGDSLAAALQIAGDVGSTAGQGIALAAQDAFVHAFQIGSVVTGAVALVGAAIALLFLPARSREEEPISITLEREPVRPELEPVVERLEG